MVGGNGKLFGDNTDARGFMVDLAEQGIDTAALQQGGALLLGAGGSARAVTYALALSGIPVHISARRPEQAQSLIDGLKPHLADKSLIINLQSLPSKINDQKLKFKLIVNCTPVGMWPYVDASPWPDDLPFHPDQFLYELIYNPPDTRLMRQARAGGAGAVNGLGMLLHQGALAWEQWTGIPAPLDAMRSALSPGPEPGSSLG